MSNALPSDSWHDSFNERERRRLREANEPLPPTVGKNGGRFGQFDDRHAFDQYCAELERVGQERPDLSFSEQQRLAYDLVEESQAVEGKNAGAYDEMEREIAAVRREFPALSLVACIRCARDRVEQRAASGVVEKSESEKARDYMGASTEELMGADSRVHSGGGGGNSARTITNKYCLRCDKRYKRGTVRWSGGKKSRVVWAPACACCAGYVSRQETEQRMGAKSRSTGGGKSKNSRKKMPPSQRAFESSAHVERDLGTNDPRDYLLHPALDAFRENSRLSLRDAIEWFMQTPYCISDGILAWIQEIKELKAGDRKRGPDEPGQSKLFGGESGVKRVVRLPKALEGALRVRLVLTFDDEDGLHLDQTLSFERGAKIRLTHVANAAIATYLWYWVSVLHPEKDHRDAASLASSPKEFGLLTELVRKGEHPMVRALETIAMVGRSTRAEMTVREAAGACLEQDGASALTTGSAKREVKCLDGECGRVIDVTGYPDGVVAKCADHKNQSATLSVDDPILHPALDRVGAAWIGVANARRESRS